MINDCAVELNPFLPCSNPYYREQMTYHLILCFFALLILDHQFLHTPNAWPSWHQSLSQVCWPHILLIGSPTLHKQDRHKSLEWRPCIVNVNFGFSRFPLQSSSGLFHSIKQLRSWEDWGDCFITWLVMSQ